MRHILIAGAADDQVSFESQEKKDGVLTGFLYDVLVNVASDLTYQTLMAQVVPLVTAYVQTNFQETQTPQLEGQDTSAPVFWGMTPQTPPAAMLPTPTPSQEGNPVQPSQEGNPATTAVVTTTASETVQHADFTLNVSTDKTHYTAGDLMTVTIQADRDCYVRLYLVSADNQVQQLFPNQWQRDNFVKGGQTVKIPGETADFQFRMAAPFGLEILKAVASTAQFADVKNMNWEGKTFVTFGNARLPDVIDRGAIVEAKPARPQISEAVAIYEVRPR